jgi:hypothetical protein
MRPLRALLNAMRTRRTRRIDLDEAGRLAAGDSSRSAHPGLGHLLDALRAPATPGELAAEKETVAAFKAHRRRAAREARRSTTRTRTRAIVNATIALGGNLPTAAQQHAHRLFSALGVPAPRTGPTKPSSPSPSPSPTPTILQLGWCDGWSAGPGGGTLSGDERRYLIAAAGREEDVAGYCERLRGAPSRTPGHAPPSRTRHP